MSATTKLDTTPSNRPLAGAQVGIPPRRMDFEFDPLTAALRQMHESVANEPIPDDFLNLLDMIDAKMSASKKFQ